MEDKNTNLQNANAPKQAKTFEGVTIEKSVGSEEKNRRKRVWKILLKILAWLIVIAGVIFLTLFVASKIAQFETIGAMIDWIKEQL